MNLNILYKNIDIVELYKLTEEDVFSLFVFLYNSKDNCILKFDTLLLDYNMCKMSINNIILFISLCSDVGGGITRIKYGIITKKQFKHSKFVSSLYKILIRTHERFNDFVDLTDKNNNIASSLMTKYSNKYTKRLEELV